MALPRDKLVAGTDLPELKREVVQERVNLYADASGDHNPIHIDPEFAKKTELGGTIAHGMLILAYISEFMTSHFGQSWMTGGSLSARFKSPARPGNTVTVSGKITEVKKEDEASMVRCEVLCQNQQGEPVIICETKVRISADEDSN